MYTFFFSRAYFSKSLIFTLEEKTHSAHTFCMYLLSLHKLNNDFRIFLALSEGSFPLFVSNNRRALQSSGSPKSKDLIRLSNVVI